MKNFTFCAKQWTKTAVFLWFGFASSAVIAAEPSQELAGLLGQFNAMTGQFTQVLYDANGKPTEKSTGTMALQRPGKFRWEVKQPDPQLLIADGNTLWIYNKDLAQATQQKLDQSSNSPALLLSGSIDSVQSRFNISYPSNENAPGKWFMLKPKSKDDMFQWVELRFNNGNLADMRLFDNMGTLTDFHFSNVKINPPLDASTFKFKAPKGVEVIKN